MRRSTVFALLAGTLLFTTGCGKKKGIETVITGTRFDIDSLVEKGKVTIIEFGADW